LAAIVEQSLTPDNRRILRDIVEPSLITLLIQSAEAQTKLAEFLKGLLVEEEGKRDEAPRSQPRRAA
jgi:hypothetical protein